ncbi:MAG: histidine phosphatase family protein [Chloroflexota bacterium]
MPANRVWLIRHGETDWNTQHRWQGHAPTSLNASGHAQARSLGSHLRDEPIGVVYSSDLPRAFQTAQPIAAAHNLNPISDPRFREINVGVFQALFPDELAELYPNELAAWRTGNRDYAPPAGESRNATTERAMAGFSEVTDNADVGGIAIVTHGGTIRLMLPVICPNDPKLQGKIPVPNTSYTLLERSGDRWYIVELTATPHLEDGGAGGNTAESSL